MSTADSDPDPLATAAESGKPGWYHELRKEVDTTLALVDASRVDLAYTLLMIIEKAPAEGRRSLVRYVAETWERAASSGELKLDPVLTHNELEALEAKYSAVVDELLNVLLDENPDVDDFYAGVYSLVCNPVFKSDHARAFVLYWVLIDNRIPYFHLNPGLRVSDADWRALNEKVRAKKAKVRFILKSSARIQQRSEEADLLLAELDDLDDRMQKIRLLAYVLWVLRDETSRALTAKALESA